MVPSGIERDTGMPLRIRWLDNGTVIVEDAYQGYYTYSGNPEFKTPIRGLQVNSRDDDNVASATPG